MGSNESEFNEPIRDEDEFSDGELIECKGCDYIKVNLIDIKPGEKVLAVIKTDKVFSSEQKKGNIESYIRKEIFDKVFPGNEWAIMFLPLDSEIEFNIISNTGDKE